MSPWPPAARGELEHLALLPDDYPDTERWQAAVASAIRLAEDCAKGSPCRPPNPWSWRSRRVRCRGIRFGARQRDGRDRDGSPRGGDSAGRHGPPRRDGGIASLGASEPNPIPHLADVTADLASRDAFLAALEAVSAEGHADSFVKAAVEDYQKLVRLALGSYPQAGIRSTPRSGDRSGRRRPRGDAGTPRDRGLVFRRGHTAQQSNRGLISAAASTNSPAMRSFCWEGPGAADPHEDGTNLVGWVLL